MGSMEVPPPAPALQPAGWRLEATGLAGGARGRWRRGSTAGAPPSVGCTAHCAVQSPHQAGCGGEAVVVPSQGETTAAPHTTTSTTVGEVPPWRGEPEPPAPPPPQTPHEGIMGGGKYWMSPSDKPVFTTSRAPDHRHPSSPA